MPALRLKGKKQDNIIKEMVVATQERVRIPRKAPVKIVPVQEQVPAPAPVQEQVPEPAPVQEEVPEAQNSEVESEEEVTFENQINELRETLTNVVKEINEKFKVFRKVDQELRKLSITAKKEFKKKAKKSKKNSSNNGFNALVIMSDELADFLELPRGSQIRPPQVSSLISKYANLHGLKRETNKAVFNCDAKMKKLFGPFVHPIKKSDPSLGNGVSIFNLNSYLKRHFTRIPTPVVA